MSRRKPEAIVAQPEPSSGRQSPVSREGLSGDAVAQRVADGLTNTLSNTSSRSVWSIVRANVFTLFNAIIVGSFILLLILGQWQDALFGFAALGNTVIGVVQEYRAKLSLDRLAVLNAPHARVVRDGTVIDIPVEDVVLDDLLILRAGDQVTADATILESTGLEVDESLLTGEAEPVNKGEDSRVLSGSSVLSGHGQARVTHVGAASFASRLTAQARQFSLVTSEIRNGLNRILRWITWALLPIMLIVANGQMQGLGGWETAIRTGSWRMGAVGAVAAVIAMIPLGLVLLTSVAFAVGGVRLAQQKVLVNELAAVEGLARVDVLCLDKTGTLTAGTITFDGVQPVSETAPAGWRKALGWFGAEPNANATARCLKPTFREGGELDPVVRVPFSSARKWSAAQFNVPDDAAGTWILGAPEIVLGDIHADTLALAASLAATGKRTLVLAFSPSSLPVDASDAAPAPSDASPVALLTFREEVRPDARETIGFFTEQGVQIRIISGDDPRTVAAIAHQVGLGTVDGFDARQLPEEMDALADVMESETVFGRVTPAQKRHMVAALQSRGHVVAMIGDGVNDVLALKDADIGIAMNSAATATRSVARLVLLDNRFDRLPGVVAEGRRVIANVERVSVLFLSKTVYAVVLSVTFGALLWGFPFLPRQLSVTDGLTIGIPAFFLALMANNRRYRPGFLTRSLSFAIPAGLIVAAAIISLRLFADSVHASAESTRTASLVTLALVALWILVVTSRPFTFQKLLIIAAMLAGLVILLAVPLSRDFLGLQQPTVPLATTTGLCAVGGAVLIEVVSRIHRRKFARG